MARTPKGFSEHPTMEYLICPHREVSCCDECAMTHAEIVDVLGQHFWIADPKERAVMVADCKALRAKWKAEGITA